MNRNSLLMGLGALIILGLISILFYLLTIQAYPWEEKGLKTYTIELYNCSEIALDTNEALTEELKSILSASKSGSNNNEFVIPIAKIVLDSGKQEFKFGIPIMGFSLLRVQTAPDAYFFDDRLTQEAEFWSTSASNNQEYINFRKEVLNRHFKDDILIDEKLKSNEWWQDTLTEFIVNIGQPNAHVRKKCFKSYQELKKHLDIIFETQDQALVGKTIKVYYLCGVNQIEPPCTSDIDGDGVCDEVDNCKDEAGPKENNGCKCKNGDQDGDGICDEADRCPSVKGVAPDGCPPPDRDGDGIPDNQDRCPNEIGGAPTGCPCKDRDKDGFCDNIDRCPDVPGKFRGCPADTDGDGVPDEKDRCNGLKGDFPYGCPIVEIRMEKLPNKVIKQIIAEVSGIETEEAKKDFSLSIILTNSSGNSKTAGKITGLISHSLNGEKMIKKLFEDENLFGDPPQTGNVDLKVKVLWNKTDLVMAEKTFSNISFMCSTSGVCGFQD